MPDLYYLVHGLRVRTGIPFPGFIPVPPCEVDLRIVASDHDGLQPPRDGGWVPLRNGERSDAAIVTVWRSSNGGEEFLIRYAYEGRIVEFLLSTGKGTIRIRRSGKVSDDEIASVLPTQVIGAYLRLQGEVCLHANVVVIDARAFLILGARGAGKSTTTAALRDLGCLVVADDLAVLRSDGQGGHWVFPGSLRVRLRKEVAEHLHDYPDDLPRVWHHDTLVSNQLVPDKRYLDTSADHIDSPAKSWKVGGLYLLARRDASLTEAIVEAVSPAEAVIWLLKNTYADFVVEPQGRALDFAALAGIAENLPIRMISRPDGLDSLPSTCRALLLDARPRP